MRGGGTPAPRPCPALRSRQDPHVAAHGSPGRRCVVGSEDVVNLCRVRGQLSSDHDLRCLVCWQPARRSQAVFELAVISVDQIVGELLDVVPRLRGQFVEHCDRRRYERSSGSRRRSNLGGIDRVGQTLLAWMSGRATAVPVTAMPVPGWAGISIVSRLGRPMSWPWCTVTVAGGATRRISRR